MHRNVDEWVEDYISADHVGAPSDGNAWIGEICDVLPGTTSNFIRGQRGGDWDGHPLPPARGSAAVLTDTAVKMACGSRPEEDETDPVDGPRGRRTAQSIDAGRLRVVDGPYAGRMPAEVRAALRSAGVDEAAANEEMARAFNDCEAAGMPLMAVRYGPHGPDDAFRLEPHLH